MLALQYRLSKIDAENKELRSILEALQSHASPQHPTARTTTSMQQQQQQPRHQQQQHFRHQKQQQPSQQLLQQTHAATIANAPSQHSMPLDAYPECIESGADAAPCAHTSDDPVEVCNTDWIPETQLPAASQSTAQHSDKAKQASAALGPGESLCHRQQQPGTKQYDSRLPGKVLPSS